MSRIPIASLANGVLFATQTFTSPSNPAGVPVLTPAVGVSCFVNIHDTPTPAAIWTDELNSVPLVQPLTTNGTGTVPGWIDTSLLPLDLTVALPTGNITFVLAGGGSGGGGGGAVASVYGRTGSIVAQIGDYTAAQVGADAAGAAAAVASTLATETGRATTAEALKAPLASPALTGTPTAPTQTALDNSTKLATTAYVDLATGQLAPAVTAGGNLAASTSFGVLASRDKWLTGTLVTNTVVTITGIAAGARAKLLLTQDATGGRTLSVSDGTNTVVVPITASASAQAVVDVYCVDSSTLWVVAR